MSAFSSLAGRMLVAMPGIGDPRFENAVILLCAHGPDHGMGLRIDRPAPGVDLAQVLRKLELAADVEAAEGRPVLVGGPVERERGFVLHTDDWLVPDASVPFGEGLAITGTREALLAMIDPVHGPRRAVLARGYAGWGDGQIEEELAENVWLVADADLDLIFDDDHDGKWAGALARIGVDAAWLSSDAGHA